MVLKVFQGVLVCWGLLEWELWREGQLENDNILCKF